MADLQRVDELGFADFVAMLLVETLDAIVASHTSQEERMRALANAAEQSVEEFAANITDEVLDAALAQLFPGEQGGTAVVAGAPPPSREDLDALDITLGKRDTVVDDTTRRPVLTEQGARTLTDGVRTHLAQTNLESIRRVALEGVPRVRVDGGVLRSKLTFSAMRRTQEEPGDGDADRVDPGRLAPAAVSNLELLSARAGRSYVPLLQKGLLDSIASTRLTVKPALGVVPGGSGTGSGSGSEQETNATIYGEVEIRFHTEI